jgi:hypothetical protein
MNTEYTGPVEVWGHADFPDHGLWDVHGPFKTEALYANGVRMSVSGEYPNGIKFYGTKGWIFRVARKRAGDEERSSGEATWQLAGVHYQPQRADLARRNGPPGLFDVPDS